MRSRKTNKKTNKKEERKNVIADQFRADTVFTREALYKIVKNNSLFKGTKNNKQLVTNALVALVGEGVLERIGNKKFSKYQLSGKGKRMNDIKDRLTSSPKEDKYKAPYERPDHHYIPQQKATKSASTEGIAYRTYEPISSDDYATEENRRYGSFTLGVQRIKGSSRTYQ